MNGNLIRRVVTGVVVVIVLVITGAIGIALWLRFSDGQRPDTSDLKPKLVAIPDGDNGFLSLNGVDSMVKGDDQFWEWLLGVKWDQAKVDALLAQNRAAVALLDEALAKPGFQCEIEFPGRSHDSWRLDWVTRMKTLSAVNHWRQGQKSLAIRENFEALETGRRLEACGVSMWMFREGVDGEVEALDNLGRFASEASAGQLQEMESGLEAFEHNMDHTEAYRNALKSEAQYFNLAFKAVASGKSSITSLPGRPLPRIESALFQPNNTQAMFVETFRQVIKEAPLTHDKIDREPGASKRIRSMSPEARFFSLNAGGYTVFLYNLSFAIPSWHADKCRIITKTGVTRALIAMRMYWLDNGKLPSSLDDLVPSYLKAVPKDAFDGKPVRYSPANKVIYSVGRDLTDNGGDPSGDNVPGIELELPVLESRPKAKLRW